MNKIKFTFDVEELINKLTKENFSIFNKQKLANYNPFTLVLQDNIIKNSNTICLPISLYNAFPELFEGKISNVVDTIKNCNYKIPNSLIKYLQEKLKECGINYYVRKLQPTFNNFIEQINKGIPVVISYKTLNSTNGHTMTFLGYDKNYIYYFDNLQQGFISNIITYIQFKTNNTYEYKYLIKLLGYSYNEKTKLSKLKRDVLVNNNLFIDATVMFTRGDVSFSDLINRLDILNTKML